MALARHLAAAGAARPADAFDLRRLRQATDWPLDYDELQSYYGKAEAEIGGPASVAQQAPLENAIGLSPPGYAYPMGSIPISMVDDAIIAGPRRLTLADRARTIRCS